MPWTSCPISWRTFCICRRICSASSLIKLPIVAEGAVTLSPSDRGEASPRRLATSGASFFFGSDRRPTPHGARYGADQKQDDKHDEQNLRDAGELDGDASVSENARDDGQNEHE